MKKMVYCFFILSIGLILSVNLYADDEIVTSKTLSIDDVKKNFMDYNFKENKNSWNPNDIDADSLTIYGVHQEGNTATVFISFRVKHTGNIANSAVSLVRFNSGEWFIVPEGIFLKK